LLLLPQASSLTTLLLLMLPLARRANCRRSGADACIPGNQQCSAAAAEHNMLLTECPRPHTCQNAVML
jgi:hypothetical protein